MNIEGPEFDLDFSYFLTNMSREIAAIEQGIPLIQNMSSGSVGQDFSNQVA